jgi:GAF domain-containing protein
MDFSSRILTREAWTELFQKYIDNLYEQVEFKSGSLYYIDRTSQSLHEIAKRGEGVDFISAVSFPMGSGLSAWVAQKGKKIYLDDIHRGSRHGLNPVRSYLSLPLELNTKIVGVLNLAHVIPNAFGPAKFKIIESTSREIARKIYNMVYLNYYAHEEHSAY